MTDLAALKAAAERATPGPWSTDSIDNDGAYGNGPDAEHGFKSYAVGCGPDDNWHVVADTLNSDVAMVEVEYDEDGTHAWDEIGRRNAEFIALSNPSAILSLIARVERYEAALKKISERKARAVLPWTHEQAANEYARMLDADRTAALRALLVEASGAMEPFAKQSAFYADIPGVSMTMPNVELWQQEHKLRGTLTVGDLRRLPTLKEKIDALK